MEDIRRMNAGLGLEAPDFGDPDEGGIPLPVNDPTSMSMYFRDKEGVLQMNAKFKNEAICVA